jgi:hypothetical protein
MEFIGGLQGSLYHRFGVKRQRSRQAEGIACEQNPVSHGDGSYQTESEGRLQGLGFY